MHVVVDFVILFKTWLILTLWKVLLQYPSHSVWTWIIVYLFKLGSKLLLVVMLLRISDWSQASSNALLSWQHKLAVVEVIDVLDSVLKAGGTCTDVTLPLLITAHLVLDLVLLCRHLSMRKVTMRWLRSVSNIFRRWQIVVEINAAHGLLLVILNLENAISVSLVILWCVFSNGFDYVQLLIEVLNTWLYVKVWTFILIIRVVVWIAARTQTVLISDIILVVIRQRVVLHKYVCISIHICRLDCCLGLTWMLI